ncbi:ABC transporter permease [Komagataeibacter sp. FNDCF1]|uniref:ABC transporter permease n=1 Tax=Komagataeibacter sp. FNDCF1 TaxID=2878681 RepID=UPI001E2A52BD|nr:ABC transporter permease [Komagataeibacter sp. FNDCF1]MCE2564125.1 ABC transporter permease [Komagataeibacter sp. FNDCF1]
MATRAFQRLPTAPAGRILALRLVAIVLSLFIIAGVLALSGHSPLMLSELILRSTIGSRFGLEDLALFMCPLLLTGAAVYVCGMIGLWNIGAEGQFYAGAIAATGVALGLHGPAAVVLPLMTVGGILGGMAWIAVPTLARAHAGVNEIITTLLLNFIAALLTYYLTTGPWRDRISGAQVSTQRIPVSIPEMWGIVHWGFPVAILMVIGLALVLSRTRWGYEIRMSGANPEAAHYAGMPVRLRIISVMLLSGGLAGLAGMFEVAGTVHRLQGGMANNFGYLGIVVAVLARGSCLNVIPAALFMALILDSGIVMQTQQLSASVVLAITGLILFMIAIGDELAHYRPAARSVPGGKAS